MLPGTYAKFAQNLTIKNHFLSSSNKLLTEASPLDLVWGIDLRENDSRANDPCQQNGEQFLGEAPSAVCGANREGETGSAHPVPSRRVCTRIGNEGMNEIWLAPRSGPLTAASAHQSPTSEVSAYFFDTPAGQSREALEIASGVGTGLALSEHGPCLVGSTVTLDDVLFSTEIQYIAEGAPLRSTDAWLSSILVPPKSSPDVTCWIAWFLWLPPRRRVSGPEALGH